VVGTRGCTGLGGPGRVATHDQERLSHVDEVGVGDIVGACQSVDRRPEPLGDPGEGVAELDRVVHARAAIDDERLVDVDQVRVGDLVG